MIEKTFTKSTFNFGQCKIGDFASTAISEQTCEAPKSKPNRSWQGYVHTWLCLQLLHATPTEERQVDMTVIINQYQQILLALTGKKSTELPVIVEGVAVLSKILDVSRASELKAALAKNGMIECLMSVLTGCQV